MFGISTDCGVEAVISNSHSLVAPNQNHLVSLHCKLLLLSTMRKHIKNRTISNKKVKNIHSVYFKS